MIYELARNPQNCHRWTPALKSVLPGAMIFFGAVLTAVGAVVSFIRNGGTEFGFAWLLAFMFYYSIALGALFLVMVHHLTDAGWSVGIRRFCEHLASLLRVAADCAVPAGRFVRAENLFLDDAGMRPRTIWSPPSIRCSRFPAFGSPRQFSSASGGCSRRGCARSRWSRTKPARRNARAKCASIPAGASWLSR